MVIDPSLCPIPPEFEIIGNLSDHFEHYKDTTGYNGPASVGNSVRWKNSKIRSANIVIGFQFRIGPDVQDRYFDDGMDDTIWYPVYKGDVNLILPRADPSDDERGVYGVSLKWSIPEDPTDHRHLPSTAIMYKEVPHGNYSGKYGFDGSFNLENPEPVIEDIKDANWHGMLAAIWNDELGTVSFALWYNPTDSHDFKDFILVGKGQDNPPDRAVPPRGPLLWGINEVDGLFSGLWGNHIFKPEHDLGIRIDDIKSGQVFIRNAYAANVKHLYLIPDPPADTGGVCASEYKAVIEGFTKIENMKEQLVELQGDLGETPPGPTRDKLKTKISKLHDELLTAYELTDAAKKVYTDCKSQGGGTVWHE